MQQTAAPDTRHYKIEILALYGAFIVLGGSFSTWASRIPAIRESAMLIPATLGYVLLIRGVGTIVAMPGVAKGIHIIGAKKLAFISGLVIILSLIPLTLSANWVVLAIFMLITGAASSTYNVSINAMGAEIEKRSGRSHMSRMHSWYGVGNLGGALLGTAAASLGITAFWHFSGMTIFLLLILLLSFYFIPETKEEDQLESATLKWPSGNLIWLGIVVFMAASIEVSVNNWVALFYTDHVGVGDGIAPVGYAAFAGALLFMRLIGDRLKMKFGAQKLLMAGSILATGGLLLSLLSQNLVLITGGFWIAGAGVALNFPMVFSAAGKQGAMALASVATFAYLGAMISQPLMGWVVSLFELGGGFLMITLFTLSVFFLSARSSLLKE